MADGHHPDATFQQASGYHADKSASRTDQERRPGFIKEQRVDGN